MARNKCPRCDRDFRGEGGLQWHLRHTHRQVQEAPVSTPQVIGAQTSGEVQANLEPASGERSGGDQVPGIHEGLDEITKLVKGFDRRLTDLDEKCYQRISKLQADCDQRITDLDTRVYSLSADQKQTKEVLAVIDPLRQDVAELKRQQVALSRLLLESGKRNIKQRVSFIEVANYSRILEPIQAIVKAADKARDRRFAHLLPPDK